MNQLKIYIELFAYLATIIGFPLAFFVFWRQKNLEKKQNHLNSYSSIDGKFFDFLKVCAENPRLHCSLYGNDSIKLNKEEEIQRITIYEMLICIFERVNIFYSYKHKDRRMKEQENAWNIYIKKWFEKKSFIEAWEKIKKSYDKKFVEDMDKLLNTV